MRLCDRTLLVIAMMVPLATAVRARGAAALAPIPIRDVRIDDPFWSPKREVWRKVTIGDCLDKFEKDGALANFDKVRDGTGGVQSKPGCRGIAEPALVRVQSVRGTVIADPMHEYDDHPLGRALKVFL